MALIGVLLAFLFIGSYSCLPSFSNKIAVTIMTVNLMSQGKQVENLSDFGRVESIAAGMHLGMANVWTGVGLGDIKQAIGLYYLEHCSKLVGKNILPHNQFVFAFATGGLVGCLLFGFAVFYPIFYYRFWQKELAIAFNIIVLTSFLFDHTLETQIGMGFYVFFQLMMVKWIGKS